jgi:hypothetical protein
MKLTVPERLLSRATSRGRTLRAAKIGLFGILWIAGLATNASADGVRSLWNHNDSEVYLYANGQGREFRYRTPKPELLQAGVLPGTLVFKGTRIGNQYSGTAYVFPRPCGALPYPVAGELAPDERSVTMYGSAPSAIYSDCTVAAYRDDVLVFELSEQTGADGREAQQYGTDGRLFSSGSDEYFLLSKSPDQREDWNGYTGQVRVVHHYHSGGFEIWMKDFSARCLTADNLPSIAWSNAGETSAQATIRIRGAARPKSDLRESYNLYWAVCHDRFRRFR